MFNLDMIFFAAMPYVALCLFVIGSAYRYLIEPFTFSSLSSQFLENDKHVWTMGPLHFGVIVVQTGHLLGFLFPTLLLLWNANTSRLLCLEVFALTFGILAFVGFLSSLVRRLTESKVTAVTSPVDWALLVLLFLQAFTGIYNAVFTQWGSTWYAAIMTPYLWSILALAPEIGPIVALPLMIKLHIVGAILIVGFFPFTRLAHILVTPLHYYIRRPQVVRWYRNRY